MVDRSKFFAQLARQSVTLASIVVVSLAVPPLAGAEANSDAAMTLFKAGKYKQAQPLFLKSFEKTTDGNCYYYYAVCLDRQGLDQEAMAAYAEVERYWPKSEAARLSTAALAPKRQVFGRITKPLPHANTMEDFSASFEKRFGESMQKAAAGKGASPVSDMKALFGANPFGIPAGVNFDLPRGNVAASLKPAGRTPVAHADPKRKVVATFYNWGPNAGINSMPRSTAPNRIVAFPMGEQDSPSAPKRPSTVPPAVSDLKPTGAAPAGLPPLIISTPPESNQVASSAPATIPFAMHGNKMIVQVEINGVARPMIWDPEAEHCIMSVSEAKAFKIAFDDAAIADGKPVYPNMIKVGSVVQTDVPIVIRRDGASILGHSFLQHCQFTIDTANKCISVSSRK